MCGIFFSLGSSAAIQPSEEVASLLRQRGPDANGREITFIPVPFSDSCHGDGLWACFDSSVLALRGSQVTKQPFSTPGSNSVLCWNGEVWQVDGVRVEGNDTALVFDLLSRAASADGDDGRDPSVSHVLRAIGSIRGPYALVYFDAPRRRIYFGRDCLGRRSLLRCTSDDGQMILSSVCGEADGDSWMEVEADGLYMIQLQDGGRSNPTLPPLEHHNLYQLFHFPYRDGASTVPSSPSLVSPYPKLNRSLPRPDFIAQPGALDGPARQLQCILRQSLRLRLSNLREGRSANDAFSQECRSSHLAILFSGGLDCTVLARLAHDIIPPEEPIDLLNVAFENPRVHKPVISRPHDAPYGLCPDRVTGKASFEELKQNWPEREWRLVEIDIPYSETQAHRSRIVGLIYPHNTEMDLSISCALYFASRGSGSMTSSRNPRPIPYESSARILLSGLGADELFGGYQRHAIAFARRGYPGLVDELNLDVTRLGKRNLGRDDRVISHWGKEVRFPYLDENFMAWALSLPAWQKCGFGEAPSETDGDDIADPAKKVLRLTARHLGLANAANEKKRAIQFGARTAKMETGKTKGTNPLS